MKIYSAKLTVDKDSLKASIFYLFDYVSKQKKFRTGRLRIKSITLNYGGGSLNANVVFDFKGSKGSITLEGVPLSQTIREDYWVKYDRYSDNSYYVNELSDMVHEEREVYEIVHNAFDRFCECISNIADIAEYEFSMDDENYNYAKAGDMYFSANVTRLKLPESCGLEYSISNDYDRDCAVCISDPVTNIRCVDICSGRIRTSFRPFSNWNSDFKYAIREAEDIEESIKSICNGLVMYREIPDKLHPILDEIDQEMSTEDCKVEYRNAGDYTSGSYGLNGRISELPEYDLSYCFQTPQCNYGANVKIPDVINMSSEQIKETILNSMKDYMKHVEEDRNRREGNNIEFDPFVYEDDSFDWDNEGNII